MKFGLQLHADRGADAVLSEAQLADTQGFDSVWTGDHLFATRGEPRPDRPLETWTLMTAIGATTRHVRLAFATLNPSFRNPALLAKMLATLDQLTHGRVICTLGAGNSPATQQLVKEVGEGWVLLSAGGIREVIAQAVAAPDWPRRKLTIVSGANVFAADTRPAAESAARQAFEAGRVQFVQSLDALMQGGFIGTCDDLAERFAELESWGVNYVRLTFSDAAQPLEPSESPPGGSARSGSDRAHYGPPRAISAPAG